MGLELTVGTATLTADMDKVDWELGAKADMGERSVGSIYVFDEENTYRVNQNNDFILKQWSLTEDASGTAVYVARGRVMNAETFRDDAKGVVVDDDGAWKLTTEDQNAELNGITLTSEWTRPEETGRDRVIALGTAFLNGTYRTSTDLDTTTYVPDTNTETMDATTYPPGTTVFDILTECALVENKIFFVTIDHELYYSTRTDTIYDCPITVSDGVSPHDAVDNSTVFAPQWDLGSALTFNGQSLASGLVATWAPEKTVFVEDTSVESAYDTWVLPVNVDEAKNATKATRLANGILSVRKAGERTWAFSIQLEADQVHLIKPGQRITLKSYAGNTGSSISRRIGELKWTYNGNGTYQAHVLLDVPRRVSAVGAGNPARPKPAPDAADQPDPTTSELVCWTWTTSTTDDTNTYGSGISRDPNTHTFSGGSFAANHGDLSTVGNETDGVPITAGTTYTFSIGKFRWKWDPSTRPIYVDWYDDVALGGANLVQQDVFESGAGRAVNTVYSFEKNLTAPVGATHVTFRFPTFHSNSVVDDMCISEVTAAAPGEADEHAFEYPDECPAESPYFVPSDTIECIVDGLQDQISQVQQTSVTPAHLITAHRLILLANRGDLYDDGDSGDSYPENTLEGFRQAMEKGLDGIEVDVAFNADGTPYAMHDTTVDRTTTGTGNVADKTDAQMDALDIDAGYGYNASRHGTSLAPPSASSIIAAVSMYDPIYLWELKVGTVEQLTTFLNGERITERSIVVVTSVADAQAAKAIDPRIHVMMNEGTAGEGDPDVDWLSWDYNNVTALADIQATAPQRAHSYIPIAEFDTADEDTILPLVFERGVRSWETYNPSNALELRAALFSAPTEEQIMDAGRWEPVTNGDVSTPEIVFDNGDVVMEWVSG